MTVSSPISRTMFDYQIAECYIQLGLLWVPACSMLPSKMVWSAAIHITKAAEADMPVCCF